MCAHQCADSQRAALCAGIWGGKGQGKTFQCNLAFKKLGIGPIVMSAGELESGNAGEPAKLIRQRYREASDVIKKGKMCAIPPPAGHPALRRCVSACSYEGKPRKCHE